jgi:hypothetical protein
MMRSPSEVYPRPGIRSADSPSHGALLFRGPQGLTWKLGYLQPDRHHSRAPAFRAGPVLLFSLGVRFLVLSLEAIQARARIPLDIRSYRKGRLNRRLQSE